MKLLPLLVLALILSLLSTTAVANVVLPLSGSPAVLIPAAGSAPGANGTFFRSDLTIVNLAAHDQLVALQWLPQGSTGNGAPPIVITIRASNGLRSQDFVHDYLNTSGIGSIIVRGVTSSGAPDSTALLYVSSRIWTPQPGTNGTTSQSFDAIPLDAIDSLGATVGAALFGTGSVGGDPAFRVNVGVVNVDSANTQLFNINIDNGLGAPPPPPPIVLVVPPMSMQQIPVGNGDG
ncbi:MAG TPA: hypothetical protein VF980_20155, partial [Thermoanaerobaculia bacterium]